MIFVHIRHGLEKKTTQDYSVTFPLLIPALIQIFQNQFSPKCSGMICTPQNVWNFSSVDYFSSFIAPIGIVF